MADNKKEIICPACKTKMKKYFIQSAGVNLDICTDGCGGIFFDNQELKKFDEQHENIDKILEILSNRTYQKTGENLKRTCPYCGNIMVKHGTSAKQLVEIDECYSCGGIFLDNQELESIRSEFKTEQERSEATKQALQAFSKSLIEELDKETSKRKSKIGFYKKLYNLFTNIKGL